MHCAAETLVMPKKKQVSKAARIADAVGIGHLILGSVLILVGEFTTVFDSYDFDHGGIKFVYQYLCAPVYLIFQSFLEVHRGDSFSVLLAGFLVVIAASVLYGMIVYALVRGINSLLGK